MGHAARFYPSANKRHNQLLLVDLKQVTDRLQQANAPLLARAEAAIVRARSHWCATPADGDMARKLIRELRALSKDLASTRLSDGRPFTDATARVKSYFADTEKTLKTAAQALLRQLSAREVVVPEVFDVIELETEPDRADSAELPDTEVEVAAIDRDLLPLEALRPYFTDYALRFAVQKYLKANGPGPLPGVELRHLVKV